MDPLNRWVVWQGEQGWHVRLVAAENGQVLLWSETYTDKRDAQAVVDRVRFLERVEVVISNKRGATILYGDVRVEELNDAVGDVDGQS